MYDTLWFKCTSCGEDTDCQTKIGDNCLDNWHLGDVTTIPDGIYIGKDKCHNCQARQAYKIENGVFSQLFTEAPEDSVQEMHWGHLRPLGADPDEQMDIEVEKMKKLFKMLEEEK